MAGYPPSWACTSSRNGVLHRQRMLISTRARSSESRTGENPTYGLTRGLEEAYCTWVPTQALNGHWEFAKRHARTKVLLYWVQTKGKSNVL